VGLCNIAAYVGVFLQNREGVYVESETGVVEDFVDICDLLVGDVSDPAFGLTIILLAEVNRYNILFPIQG
jgi:hypothetical protein